MGTKMLKPLIIVTVLLPCSYLYAESAPTDESIHFLKPGGTFENHRSGLQIFCHNANPKRLINMWKSLTMHLSTNLDNYDLYDGTTPQEVREKHEEDQRSWRFNIIGTRKGNRIKINPFQDACIGVYAYPSNLHYYTMSLSETSIDVSKLTLMLFGAITFWSARKLSGNPVFYYLCGITLGVGTSILISVYLVGRLLPRGKLMYLMVATGWTMGFYLIQTLWENARLIATQYKELVMWYILLTSFISFVICYRFGPVTNVRTKKLIQWFLQIGGLIAIYHSSCIREASCFCCILILLIYNFPTVLIRNGRSYW